MLSHTHGLALQSVWNSWSESATPFDLSWKNLIYGPGPHLLKFVLNSIINCVQTPDMLNLWGYTSSAYCSLCGAPQCTLHHILANCEHALNGSRYNWRHDSILANMEPVLRAHVAATNSSRSEHKVPEIERSFLKEGTTPSKKKSQGSVCRPSLLQGVSDWKLQIDYEKSKASFPVEILSTSQRPDVVIFSMSRKKVFIIELTCPAEEGIKAAQLRKEGRYAPLAETINNSTAWSARVLTFEVGARGFVALSTRRLLNLLGLPIRQTNRLLKTLSSIAAKCSYEIYLHRSNKIWDSKRDLLVSYESSAPTTFS